MTISCLTNNGPEDCEQHDHIMPHGVLQVSPHSGIKGGIRFGPGLLYLSTRYVAGAPTGHRAMNIRWSGGGSIISVPNIRIALLPRAYMISIKIFLLPEQGQRNGSWS